MNSENKPVTPQPQEGGTDAAGNPLPPSCERCGQWMFRKEVQDRYTKPPLSPEVASDLTYFLRLSEHKLDQRLQGQYTNEQIFGMLLKLSRELLLKHKIPALDALEGKS